MALLRGVRGKALGSFDLTVRGGASPSVRSERSRGLRRSRAFVRSSPRLPLQPPCCNALPFADSGLEFRSRSQPRRGGTPPPGRGNVLLDPGHPA